MRVLALPETYHDVLGLVTPAQIFGDFIKSDALIQEAHLQIDRAQADWECEREAERKINQQKGYEAGYLEGLKQFSQALRDAEAAQESDINTTLELVRECLMRILKELPSEKIIEAAIRTACDVNGDGRDLTIALHPSKKIIAEALVLEVFANDPTFALLKIVEDGSLSEDDYVLYTPSSIMDVSITGQVDTLCRAMRSDLDEQIKARLDRDITHVDE